MTIRIADDPDMWALAAIHARHRPHNGFDLAPCAAYCQEVSDLTDATSAVRCAYHRERAATYQLGGRMLCSSCANEALIYPEGTRHED
jgi:hypothetical protein